MFSQQLCFSGANISLDGGSATGLQRPPSQQSNYSANSSYSISNMSLGEAKVVHLHHPPIYFTELEDVLQSFQKIKLSK